MQPQDPNSAQTPSNRPSETESATTSDQSPVNDIQTLHEASIKKYPQLNLSAKEHVVTEVQRSKIGIYQIWIAVAVIIIVMLVLFTVLVAINRNASSSALSGQSNLPIGLLGAGLIILCLAVLLGGFVSAIVYKGNRLFVTNESVIQYIQKSLFDKRQQTIGLGGIEDSSYEQIGMFAQMWHFGQIRLSTVGDETTYRFTYVTNPEQQIALISNAVESFKNGQPDKE
jgi:uncharacterized integral membrane protein